MSRVLSIGGTVYFVQYLQGSLQLGATAAGRLLVPVFVARMAAGMLGGKLLSRFHPGRVIASGYLARALGAAGTAVAVGVGPPPLLLVVPLVVWGAGIGTAALGAVYGAWAGSQPSPESIAAATTAVLACPAALAVLTTAAVLRMISRSSLHARPGPP